MNIVRKVNGWRSLAGMLGVGALALGLSLKLEGAPSTPSARQSVDAAASADAPETTVTNPDTDLVSARPASTTIATRKPNRITTGKIPSTGLSVIATIEVDWRDDEGTRLRQAGKLVGPMPRLGVLGAGQAGGVAEYAPHNCRDTGPGECSFAIDCDDNNKCTTDRCDFVGVDACTGHCVHDPVPNFHNVQLVGCDNGIFCDGKETCLGAKCTIVTAPNVIDQPCDSHASCGVNGTCNTGTNLCTVGNVGAACNKNEDCDEAGTCAAGPNAGKACDSDTGCPTSTCTVKGFCSPGICTNGTPAICCNEGDNITVCAEDFPRCDAASLNAGVGCQTSSDCKGGLCERCQPSCEGPEDCADGRDCNGEESCLRTCVGGADTGKPCPPSACTGGTCLGQCQPGINPCGAGARCSDKRCGEDPPFEDCLYDSDCPLGPPPETCNERPAPGYECFLGRCCLPNAENPGACSLKKLGTTDPPSNECVDIAGSHWYMDDDGENLPNDPCGGFNSADVQRTDPWNCPKYSSGFAQHDANTPPIYPLQVGPISDSIVCAPAPSGPGGTCPNPIGPPAEHGQLYQLGDDFTVFNGDYMGLDVVRLVLNVVSNSRLSMDIYDHLGNFVEDVNIGFNFDLAPGIGIIVAIFRAPLTIPPQGYIVLRTSERFEPDAKAFWLSTTANGPGLVGSNFDKVLWINTYPGVPATVQASNGGLGNNYLKMCAGGPKINQPCVGDADCPDSTCTAAPGILAFELVGDKIGDPVGGCCLNGGGCTDGVVSWVCTGQHNSYLGDGQLCVSCNGGSNSGGSCRTCVGGGHNAGLTCSADSQCRTCLGGTAPVGTPCTSVAQCPGGGASCPAGGTCSSGPDTARCRTCVGGTGPPATPCTGAPNAPCGTGGTCPSLGSTCSTGKVGDDCSNVCSNKKCDGNRVCSESAKKCSVSGATCTGTGIGNCDQTGPNAGQTCNYITVKKCSISGVVCTGGPGPGDCNQDGANAGQLCSFINCTDNTPCTPVGATCPAAQLTCTGTGQGTCPPNQACIFVVCPDGDCIDSGEPGGTCGPNNDFCDLAGTCNLETLSCVLGSCVGGPNQGLNCTTNTDCPNSTCVSHACTANAQCGVEGTCVAVACEEAALCGSGACCNTTTGACTIHPNSGACETSGGTWQGNGTDCDADNGYEEALQHCCPIPYDPNLRCMGGPNNLQSCTTDANCRFCVGGSHNGEACTTTSAAEPNGCLNEGLCNLTTHKCEGGLLPVCTGSPLKCVGGPQDGDTCVDSTTCLACLTDADCPDNSGACRGKCISRGTGADNCNDVYIHVITVPELVDGPKVLTISGSNIDATDTEDEPENCQFGTDPMWWDAAFSIDKCARVRLDFCCSDPTREPSWGGIVTDCDPIDGSCTTVLGDTPDPYTAGQDASARGLPYCAGGDDVWETYGPLEPGTYVKPVYSDLAGAHGNYQMHITVQACPIAACCYQVCGSICEGGSNPGDICNGNEDCFGGGTCSGNGGPNFGNRCDKTLTCPGGTCKAGSVNQGDPCTEHFDCGPLSNPLSVCSVTCLSQCTEVEKNACDALFGYFLAPPNTRAVPLCTGAPCENGSCCLGPGTCIDQVSETDDTKINKAYCDEVNGNFVGKVRCAGSTCIGGGDDEGESCNVNAQCALPGFCDDSSLFALSQVNPCPVCAIEGSGNCQRFENSDDITPSDRGTGSGQLQADDFVPSTGGPLTTVCVWGLYDDTDLLVAGTDCGGPEDTPNQRDDNFRVRIYEDDPDNPGKPAGGNCSTTTATRCFNNGQCPSGQTCLPKALHESAVSNTNRTKAVVPGAATQFSAALADAVNGPKTWVYSLTLNTPSPSLMGGKCYWLEVSNDTGPEYGSKCTWHWSNLLKTSSQGNFYSASGSAVNGYDDGSLRNWDQAWCLNMSAAPGGCASLPGCCCTCQNVNSLALLKDCDDDGGVWHVDACGTPACAPPSNDRCQDAPTVPGAGRDGTVPVGLYSVSTQCATTDGFDAGHRANTPVENDVWYYYTPAEDCHLRADSCSSGTISFFDSVIVIYTNPGDPSHCPCPASQSSANTLEVDADDDGCVILGAATGGVAEVDAIGGQCYTIRVGGFPGANAGGRTGVDISCGAPVCGDGRRNAAEACDGLDNANCRLATPSTLCNANCTCGAPNPCGTGGVIDPGEECDPSRVPPGCGAESECLPAGHPKQCTCTAHCGGGNNHVDEGEDCDGTADAACPGRCRSSEVPPVCECPPLVCGNGRLEDGAGEECEFGACTLRKCSGAPNNTCTLDSQCAPGTCDRVPCLVLADCTAVSAGTCDLTLDREDCPSGQCRTPTDPLGGCRCGCELVTAVNIPVWDPAKMSCTNSGADPTKACAVAADCGLCTLKKCSGLPANSTCTGSGTTGTCPLKQCSGTSTTCTGTGQGSCSAGQTCDFTGQTCDFVDCVTTAGECTPVSAGTCTAGPPGVCLAWPNNNPEATTRSLRFRVVAPPGPAGPSKLEAIKVTMVDLQHPKPANLPTQAPTNMTTYDTKLNSTCAGATASPNYNGHHCDVTADCDIATGTAANDGTCTGQVACTADPACTDPLDCTLPSNSCSRWVGKPGTFYEAQGPPQSGPYRAARLQCTPYYFDWKPEGLITVVGGDIAPSSEYSVEVYGTSCIGAEDGCIAVSSPVTMYTRRSGDVEVPFNPPSSEGQPNVTDIAQLVNKVKSLPGAPVKAISQLQPNLPEMNTNINVSDIVAVVDAVKLFKYAYSGPCPCPSLSACNALGCATDTACRNNLVLPGLGAGALCVKTCTGPGPLTGEPCLDNTHCVGSGTCGAGFCRDRCGRCTLP